MTASDDSRAGFRVFLSGVIQGSHQDTAHHDQSYRDRLRELLKSVHPEVEVVCPVDLNPDSAGYNDDDARETFFEELDLAAAADVTIAFAPVATMGTAVEMYRAFDAGRLVFTISPMAQNWAVRHLSSRVFPDLATFEAFVRAGEVGKALAASRAKVRA
jgi:hypothetical protein